MIGDAKRIYRLARGFWQNGIENTYVGKNFILRSDDDIQHVAEQEGKEIPRVLNGILAWLKRAHYNEVKHCTAKWKKFVSPFLADPTFQAVYCHFLFTYPLLADQFRDKVFVIDTHNSEWGWYRAFRESTKNPMIKQVCDFSMRRADEIMKMLPSSAIMAHVSQSDCDEYVKIRPDIAHMVIPNGGDIQIRETVPDYRAPRKKLLFFGSLHGKMSFDAIKHFEQVFWPVVKDHSHVIIAGANPSTAIEGIATKQGWEMRRNLSESQVDDVFNETHYSIMPFTYGAGSKLKFFDACARGVPILTTVSGACGQEGVPDFVTISDEPSRWKEVICNRVAMEDNWQQEVTRFGETFTWKSIAQRILPLLAERTSKLRSK